MTVPDTFSNIDREIARVNRQINRNMMSFDRLLEQPVAFRMHEKDNEFEMEVLPSKQVPFKKVRLQ